MAYSIYIADDEKYIRELIQDFLKNDGYEVTAFETGDALMECFWQKPSDLVILDIMMPGTDGLTVCRLLREQTDVPIIMLTAKDSEIDYVQGISIGSDDYLTKPFRPTVLLMRVKALLRRIEMSKKAPENKSVEIKIGNLVYNSHSNMVTCDGKPVGLTQMERKMFTYMLRDVDKEYTRDEILENVWGYNTDVETRVTDETMRRVRRKLSIAGSNVSVATVWGIGYKIQFIGE